MRTILSIVFDVRDPLGQQPQRLQSERPVAAIHEKAGTVGGPDRVLTHRLARCLRELQRTLIRKRSRHDLQQTHQRRRIEEVHAHDALGPVHRRRDRRDRQRRGVARQHALGPDDPREAGEQLALQLHSLWRGLDHQVALGHIRELGDRLDPAGCRLRVLLP